MKRFRHDFNQLNIQKCDLPGITGNYCDRERIINSTSKIHAFIQCDVLINDNMFGSANNYRSNHGMLLDIYLYILCRFLCIFYACINTCSAVVNLSHVFNYLKCANIHSHRVINDINYHRDSLPEL